MQQAALEKALGITLTTLPLDTELDVFMRHEYKNHCIIDEAGQVVALNLCDGKWTDEKVKPIWKCYQLKALNLSDNQLTGIVIPEGMDQLQYIDVSDNESLTSFEFTNALQHLERFDASDCKLQALEFPASCDSLQYLDVSRNELRSVNMQEGLYSKLTCLDLSDNQLSALALPDGLENLLYAYLNGNGLKELSFSSNLPSLLVLHLRDNQLEELPDNFTSLANLETLYLHGNPLTQIPKEVVGSGERHNSAPDVMAYLLELKEGEKAYLHQAKLILVGNEMVGKTSIRLKLIDEEAELPKKEDRTEGLDIQTYRIEKLTPEETQLQELIDFQLNIWDFGGQGKYREIQQLFCSRKSLYLFVTAHDDLPLKQHYIGFQYWLSMVNAHSYDKESDVHSPIIHVVNKIDEESRPINQKDLTKDFPNIADFVAISCKERRNLDQLKQAIRETLPKVDPAIFKDAYPKNWLEVKQALEEKATIKEGKEEAIEHHITYGQYLKICKDKGLDEKAARSWLDILDRIGTVIHFGENESLGDWIILNPLWVKDALYKVLNSKLVEDGLLKERFLPIIWEDYNAREREKLLQLMLAYKLCYERKDSFFGKKEFLLPSMLNGTAPNLPDFLLTPDVQLKFGYKPFLPAGTLSKFTVDMNNWIFRRLMWKNNVIIHDPSSNTYAHLREDWDNGKVLINLFGEELKGIYALIYQKLKSINEDLKNARFLHHLDFEVYGKYKNKWRSFSDLKDFDTDAFSFLWETVETQNIENTIHRGETKDANGEGAQEIPPFDLSIEKVKVLFLASVTPPPKGFFKKNTINWEKEYNEIETNIGDSFQLEGKSIMQARPQVNIPDLTTEMFIHEPHIFHFCGHGYEAGLIDNDENELVESGLAFWNEEKNGEEILTPEGARTLFNSFNENIPHLSMVLLNACYSEAVAKSISANGILAIGTSEIIFSDAARSFSTGFYRTFTATKDWKSAMEAGLTLADLKSKGIDIRNLIRMYYNGQRVY